MMNIDIGMSDRRLLEKVLSTHNRLPPNVGSIEIHSASLCARIRLRSPGSVISSAQGTALCVPIEDAAIGSAEGDHASSLTFSLRS